MVCFKRKPVRYLPFPIIKREDAELWVIPETDEAFTDYTSYLQRMEFYKQKKFVCELTGHSGLTFFDALESEKRESQGIGQIFPVALKEKVLRKVQFSTISRVDALVDWIYEDFKQDFYPGEHVTVLTDDGDRVEGTIREKGRFAEVFRPDGTRERGAFSRYWVVLDTLPLETVIIDDPQYIARDRKSFTKQIIKTFIKDNVTREAWNGAPWLVKDAIADRFKIDRDVPLHLQHGNKRRKMQKDQPTPQNPGLLNFVLNPPRLSDSKPASKAAKGKQTPQRPSRPRDDDSPDPLESNGKPGKFVNGKIRFIAATPTTLGVKSLPIPAPPPPVKYPIDDLEVPPTRDGTHRPALKYLSRDTPLGAEDKDNPYGVLMKSVGPLLETWNTLNVFCQVLFLDSFTFDDYLECLHLAPKVQTELYAEIHCALLKILVEEESEGGEILVKLPELPDDDSSDDERSGTERSQSATPARQVRATKKKGGKKRGTRSRSATASRSSSRVPSNGLQTKSHRAAEMTAEYDWIDRLRQRDFKQGGWEMIIVGLLDRLSVKPQLQSTCRELLEMLAPLDEEPTQETARAQYAELDINARIAILQILTLLIVDLKSIRGEMESSSELMTEVRKEKMEWQRTRRTAIEELRVLDEQRKILQPQFATPPPDPSLDFKPNLNGEDAADGTTGTERDTPSMNGDASQGARRHGRPPLAGNKKRKRPSEPEQPQKPELPLKKLSKGAKHLEQVMRDLEKKKAIIRECETEIAKAEEDLREIDCPRTRCLGKDRFMNRYWFLERNAMPWAGLHYSSTADAEYANGCVWVQGPDDLERMGFIDVTPEEERTYRKTFQMTVQERKRMEEGPTNVFNARQWGYYDEPDSLDLLIGWLDPRGHRELKLRKELQNIRGKIITHMAKRQAYLTRDEKTSTGDEHATRVSRRIKTQPTQPVHRCQRWKNTMAVKEFGHLHSDPPKPRKAAQKAGAAKTAKRGVAVLKEKPLTRQGTRYNF